LKTLPVDSQTVTDIYQQDVYDEQDKKIVHQGHIARQGWPLLHIVGIGGL
jgi:hypothetical protein